MKGWTWRGCCAVAFGKAVGVLWVWVMRLLDVGYYCRWLGKGGGWREAEQHDVVTSRTHCSFSLSHTLSHFLLTHTHTHTLSHSLSHSLSTVHIHPPTLAGCHSLHLPLIAHSSQPTDHLRADQQPHFRIRPQHHNNNNDNNTHPQAQEQIPTRTRAGQSRAKQIGVEQSR